MVILAGLNTVKCDWKAVYLWLESADGEPSVAVTNNYDQQCHHSPRWLKDVFELLVQGQ